MDMLKEEPKLLYIYEYIKIDEKRLPNINGKKSHIGDLFLTEDTNKDKEFYKFICTIRRAFVGDIQEKLNIIHGEDISLKFAKNKKNINHEFYYKEITKTVYVEKPSLFKRVWSYFVKGKEDDLFLERELEKDKTVMNNDQLVSLEDYLNCKDEEEIKKLQGTGFYIKN